MSKAFVYGMSVEGENFTDRVRETARLKLNFENGINTVLISPRRMGKTSVVKKAMGELAGNEDILTVYMDIYECRSEYDFYNKFAAALGITPTTHSPEEVLNLPEMIARKRGKSVVVCIDEFQQIGEMQDSLTIQKRLRGVWQHQQHCSYCLFGSKKHMMLNLFQNKRMPFYQFGEIQSLGRIPTADWVSYIQQRFKSRGKSISTKFCERICAITQNYSSYVQQLAWNVFAETEKEATEESMTEGLSALIAQNCALFQQQIAGLSSYQLNFLRAIKAGIRTGFTTRKVMETYNLGTKSNITRLQTSLIEKELIELREDGLHFADPVMELWYE